MLTSADRGGKNCNVIRSDRGSIKYLPGSAVHLCTAYGCARSGCCNGPVTGGQCNMGGTFPGFGKKRDASYIEKYAFEKDVIKMIAGLGISPFIMQSTESLVTITLNTGLQRYGGDLYVGSMSILMSVMQMITIPVQGSHRGYSRSSAIIMVLEIRNV